MVMAVSNMVMAMVTSESSMVMVVVGDGGNGYQRWVIDSISDEQMWWLEMGGGDDIGGRR